MSLNRMSRSTAIILALALAGSIVAQAGIIPFRHKKSKNPLADVNSKQPDKVLFDRSMDALDHGKYDMARITLQTLINTYPDSEYIARAKLGIGDAWYREGGTTALAQAELEYKDFITFFPNLPEAAEAQLKVANIHYRQMEKPDRDYTHALRAEDEYRQLVLQFPDSKLVPQAKERLREVQEVLAEREYRIGRFYYMRESWPASIARFQTLVDEYPLYSNADDALYLLGSAYEEQVANARKATNLKAEARARLIKDFSDKAAGAYALVITRYPEMDRASDAKKRLQAMERPVPEPTKEAIAQNKAEEASRSETSRFGRVMGNFKRGPDVARTAKVGEPSLSDPAETSAVAVVRQAGTDIQGTIVPEVLGTGGDPTKSEPIPNSSTPAPGTDATPATTVPTNAPPTPTPAPAASPAASNDATAAGSTSSGASGADSGIPELQPLGNGASGGAAAAPTNTPAATSAGPGTGAATQALNQASSSPTNAGAPVPPPPQVNDAATPSPGDSASSTPAASTDKGSGDSSSKKKKKKGLHKLVPF